MKKILIISIALLFGCTLFAQNAGDNPKYQGATYTCGQMLTDYNNLPPWSVLITGQMLPDAFPPSAYSSTKYSNANPDVFNYPVFHVLKNNPPQMQPNYPNDPIVALPNMNKLLPN